MRKFVVGALAVLFASCASSQRSVFYSGGEAGSALLAEVRERTREEGLVEGKRRLVEGLVREDASGGELERRVMRTTRDPGLVLPDSLAALPPSCRARIAVAIVPGTKATNPKGRDRTRECLRGAAEESRRMGFSACFVETEARGTVEGNAALIAAQLREVFVESDVVVLVMLSKGAHDVIRYLREDGANLPAGQREKLVAVFSLAGTVQGSVVADWMAHSPRPFAAATRGWLRLSGQEPALSMLESLARSPWEGTFAERISELFPNLTWISIAMVPDGEDGRISERLWAPLVRRRIERTAPYYSPVDGLLESAASVLPDAVELPEWIVVGFGSHAIPNGVYRDGGRIAPFTTRPGREKLKRESGAEIMGAYLRALPATLLR